MPLSQGRMYDFFPNLPLNVRELQTFPTKAVITRLSLPARPNPDTGGTVSVCRPDSRAVLVGQWFDRHF